MAWQLTPVFLPGESRQQESLVGTDHGVTKSRTQLKRLSTQHRQDKYRYSLIKLMNTDSTDDTNKTFKKAGKLLENTTLKKYCHDKINDFWL